MLSIASSSTSLVIESSMEVLVEELIDLHAASPTFRQVFRSQQTTQIFVDAYKSFVTAIGSSTEANPRTIRILEKISQFSRTLTLDSDVAVPQKREVGVPSPLLFNFIDPYLQLLDTVQSAEAIYNPNYTHQTPIDPEVVADCKSRRLRVSSKLSVQLGDRTTNKSMARMHDWRNNIMATERKRLRKTALDL